MSNQPHELAPMASILANRASQAAVALSIAAILIGAGMLAGLVGAAIMGHSPAPLLYVTAAVVAVIGGAALVGARRFRRAHERALAAYRGEPTA